MSEGDPVQSPRVASSFDDCDRDFAPLPGTFAIYAAGKDRHFVAQHDQTSSLT